MQGVGSGDRREVVDLFDERTDHTAPSPKRWDNDLAWLMEYGIFVYWLLGVAKSQHASIMPENLSKHKRVHAADPGSRFFKLYMH